MENNHHFQRLYLKMLLELGTFLCSLQNTTTKMLGFGQSIAFNLLKQVIRLKFPDVPRMTTGEFAQELADFKPSQPLVLDARTEVEYIVSHLAEAKQIDVTSDLTNAPALKDVSKDALIVIYCSVGYRSAKVAQQLQQVGFQNVFNLEGGLFQWANEGRSLVHAGQPTQLVHPYSAVWGMLLKKQNHLQE
jgi:rhodanese-related sulfurtransferase